MKAFLIEDNRHLEDFRDVNLFQDSKNGRI